MKDTEQYRTYSLPLRALQSRWRQKNQDIWEPGENSPGQDVTGAGRCLGSEPPSTSVPAGAQRSVPGETTHNSQVHISPLSMPYPQPYSCHLKTPDSLFSCYSKCNQTGERGADGEGPWMSSRDWCHTLPPGKICFSPTNPQHREISFQGGWSDHLPRDLRRGVVIA